MRVDANISLRPAGSSELNVKVEVKNMNSVKSIGDAIAHEIERQKESLDRGEEIVLHTRLWNPARGKTEPMREKFAGPCVPDPSVPEVVVSDEWLAEIKAFLPEMPAQKRLRFIEQYDLTGQEAESIASSPENADYAEAVIKAGASPRLAVQWITARLLPAAARRGQTLAETRLAPERLAGFLALVESNRVNPNAAKQLLDLLLEHDGDPEEILEKHGLDQATDAAELAKTILEVLAENPGAVEDFHAGKTQALGFLTGRAVRLAGGKADPRLIRRKLEEMLRAGASGG